MKTLGSMYLRSIRLYSNKKIFDVHQLPITKYLTSLGLNLCDQYTYNCWNMKWWRNQDGVASAIAPIKCTEVSNTSCTCKKGYTRWKWAHTTYRFVLHEELGCSYTDLEENQESNGDLIPLGSIKPIPIGKLSERATGNKVDEEWGTAGRNYAVATQI